MYYPTILLFKIKKLLHPLKQNMYILLLFKYLYINFVRVIYLFSLYQHVFRSL